MFREYVHKKLTLSIYRSTNQTTQSRFRGSPPTIQQTLPTIEKGWL
jgi:hypothetical protein